jgi:PAS domain-containing protein
MSNAPASENDFDPAIERKLLGGLVVALLIVAGMVWAAIQNNSRQAESAAWVNHTHAFILETDAILSSLHAAEAAQRTFLLTQDAGVKLLATQRFGEVKEHFEVAQKLAFENPAQLKRLEQLEALLQKQIDWNKQGAANVFTNAAARTNILEIERAIAEGRRDENALLLQREQRLQRHTRRTEEILYSGVGLNLGLLGFAFFVVHRDLKLRRRAANALQAANESLEVKVKERTAELGRANEQLQIENLEQKWGQAALRRVVQHHELILNSIRESIFVVSRNGHIISSNAAAEELVGPSAGKTIQAVFENADSLAAAVKEGRTLEGESIQLRSGVKVRVACYPAHDRENLTGAVVTVLA